MSEALVAALIAADTAGVIAYVGQVRGGRYKVAAAGPGAPTRTLSERDATAWLAGARAGYPTHPGRPDRDGWQDPPGELDTIRGVLSTPSLPDQCRTQIRAAMESVGLTLTDMVARVEPAPVTRKAAREALTYGRTLSMDMASRLMAATGCEWHVEYRAPAPAGPGPGPRPPVASPVVAPPEPAGLSRVRVVMFCHEHRHVRWVNPSGVNQAIRPRAVFRLERPDRRVYDVAAADVVWWLAGVADQQEPGLAGELFAKRRPWDSNIDRPWDSNID